MKSMSCDMYANDRKHNVFFETFYNFIFSSIDCQIFCFHRKRHYVFHFHLFFELHFFVQNVNVDRLKIRKLFLTKFVVNLNFVHQTNQFVFKHFHIFEKQKNHYFEKTKKQINENSFSKLFDNMISRIDEIFLNEIMLLIFEKQTFYNQQIKRKNNKSNAC